MRSISIPKTAASFSIELAFAVERIVTIAAAGVGQYYLVVPSRDPEPDIFLPLQALGRGELLFCGDSFVVEAAGGLLGGGRCR